MIVFVGAAGLGLMAVSDGELIETTRYQYASHSYYHDV